MRYFYTHQSKKVMHQICFKSITPIIYFQLKFYLTTLITFISFL